MSKKLTLVFMGIIFFSNVSSVKADVIINEVAWMGSIVGGSADANAEWIELKNTGDSNVDLSGWILVSNDGTPNIILSDKCTNLNINAGGFLLLERTNDDSVPGISANCIYAGALGNAGEFLVLKDANGNTIQSLDFSGSWPAGDNETKETMQWNDSSWVTAAPTPTRGEVPPPSGGGGSSSGGSSSSTPPSPAEPEPEPKPKVIENPTMKAKILANALAFAGEPLKIKTNIFGYSNENVILGRVSWNFGDGGTFEQINNFEEFAHTYYYPGEYVLFLEYYKNNFSTTPEVTNKMIIKVLATTVTISKVGDAKDFFIELSNNASSDINISNWVINAGGKTFVLPKNSVILSKKQMTISGKITGFSYGDQYNLKLFSSTGELVFDYSSSVTTASFSKVAVSPKNAALKAAVTTPTVLINKDEQAFAEGLSASALNSNVFEEDEKRPYSSSIIPIASIVFIGAGAGAVYFIRRKKIIPKAGGNFEILDE